MKPFRPTTLPYFKPWENCLRRKQCPRKNASASHTEFAIASACRLCSWARRVLTASRRTIYSKKREKLGGKKASICPIITAEETWAPLCACKRKDKPLNGVATKIHSPPCRVSAVAYIQGGWESCHFSVACKEFHVPWGALESPTKQGKQHQQTASLLPSLFWRSRVG